MVEVLYMEIMENIMKGEWVDGLKDGPGTYVKQDGEKYTGNWKKGKYHGKGKLHNKERL